MLDLLPLLMATAGVVVALSTIVLIRTGRIQRSPRVWVAVLVVGSLIVAGTYIAYFSIDGDPDVWDFYRSVWFVPIAVFGGFVAYVAYLFRRRGASATATAN